MSDKYKTKKQMEILSKKIIKAFKEGKGIFLVGKTNEGKTYFAKNFLIPYLTRINIKAKYFENINQIKINKNLNLAVIDEVEILSDREFLEKEHPEENYYYSEKYLRQIKKWHEKLSKFKIPCVCLLTRSNQKDINYLKKKNIKTEWNSSPAIVLEYKN